MYGIARLVLRGLKSLGGADPEAEPEQREVIDLDNIRITVPVDIIEQFRQVEIKHADEPLYEEQFFWTIGAAGMRQMIDIARESGTPDEAMLTIFANTRFERDEDGKIIFHGFNDYEQE